MAINRLNEGEFSSASQIPFYDPANGCDRRASVESLKDALGVAQAAPMTTQYAAPSSDPFSVLINPPEDGASVFLLLTPTGSASDGEVVLPLAAKCKDGQEVLVVCTQDVAALVVDGNGAGAVVGAPTAISAPEFFRLRFDAVLGNWYRVG